MSKILRRKQNHVFINNQDGFTLIEIIMSIVILAIVSGIVIQLFMVSKDLGNDAKVIDLATINAANAIEIVKSLDNPADVNNHEFFSQSNHAVDEYLVMYYDENFDICHEDIASYVMEMSIQADNDYLTLSVDEYFNADGRELVSTLYDIEVLVINIETGDLVTNQLSSQYYTFVR